MDTFQKIAPRELNEGAVKLVGYDWMLITAGVPGNFNTMTAAWGGLGYLWNKPMAYIFIRPQRYTYEFVEQNDIFTLQFFDESYRKMLNYCGTYSGRDVDKISETGLTPFDSPDGGIYFREARIQLQCRKVYYEDIVPENFLSEYIQKHYPAKDYHRMYFGEITECLVKVVE